MSPIPRQEIVMGMKQGPSSPVLGAGNGTSTGRPDSRTRTRRRRRRMYIVMEMVISAWPYKR